MSSIIPFRLGATDTLQTDNLRDMLATGTESVRLGSLLYERLTPPSRDWSNQEIADLARVQYLLSRAGVQLETERGLTDEGDPWFVFCDMNGEVFVHVCRMGMTYLLDSPSLETPLRGLSFDALVNSFIERATTRAAALNVVPLDKTNKVFLHPSVMLAALVWSLYLLSDQMTNAAYASGMGDTAPSLVAGASEPQDPDTAFSLLAEMLQETRNAENGSSTGLADRELELGQATAGPRAIQAPMSSATGPVVSSLSAIAVALGFWHPTESMAALLAEAADVKAVTAARTLQQVQVIVADTPRAEHAHADHAQHAMTPTETAEQIHTWSHAALAPNAINLVYDLAGVTLDILSKLTAGMNQSLGTETLQQFLSREILGDGSHRSASAFRSSPSDQRQDASRSLQDSRSGPEGGSEGIVDIGVAAGQQLSALRKVTSQVMSSSSGNVVVNVSTDAASTSSRSTGPSDSLLAALGENVTAALKGIMHFDFGLKGTFLAKSEATETVETDKPVAEPVASDTGPKNYTAPPLENSGPAPKPVTYNAAVEALIIRILAKKEDVLIVNLDNGIVIIDQTSLDDLTDQAYAHTWTVAGGGEVSTVGHYADYKDLGLLT